MARYEKVSKWLMATVSALAISPVYGTISVKAQEAESLGTIVVTDDAVVESKALESDTVIGAKELKALNAQTVQDLFSSTPAIVVGGGSIAAQKFYLHGLDQAKVNVVIDGARQRSGIWHHSSGDIGVEPSFLKKVDVKSGVSPADAGPGALAGTVFFETKDAKDLLEAGQTIGGSLSAGYKSNSGTYQVTGAGYAVHDGLEFVGIVKHTEGGNYKDGGGKKELGTDPNAWNGLVKVAHESDEGHRFEVSGERFSDSGLRRLRADMNMGGTVTYNKHTTRRTTVTASYENTKGAGLFDPEFLFYLTRNELERPYGAYPNRRGPGLAYAGDFNSDMLDVGGKLLNNFHFEKGKITAGVDFYNNHLELDRFYTTPGAANYTAKGKVNETIRNIGALVQARFEPFDRLEISTGARVDFQRYEAVDGKTFENSGFSPNFSASFEIFDGLKFNAGAASVFGGLEPSEMALYAGARPYVYDANLKATRSNNIEAGFSYKNYGWTAQAKLFHTKMTNPLAYNWRVNPFRRVNGKDLESRGFDVSVRYDWSNAYLSAAFTHTDVKYDGKTSGLVYNTSTTVGDMLTLQGAYTFEDWHLTVGALGQFAFDIDEKSLFTANSSAKDDLKGYQAVDVFAEYKPEELMKGLTLRADVTNLFDQEYAARGGRVGGARGRSNWEPVHNPGRSFNLTLTKKF